MSFCFIILAYLLCEKEKTTGLFSLGEDSCNFILKGKCNHAQVGNILYSQVSNPHFVPEDSKRFEHNIQLF